MPFTPIQTFWLFVILIYFAATCVHAVIKSDRPGYKRFVWALVIGTALIQLAFDSLPVRSTATVDRMYFSEGGKADYSCCSGFSFYVSFFTGCLGLNTHILSSLPAKQLNFIWDAFFPFAAHPTPSQKSFHYGWNFFPRLSHPPGSWPDHLRCFRNQRSNCPKRAAADWKWPAKTRGAAEKTF